MRVKGAGKGHSYPYLSFTHLPMKTNKHPAINHLVPVAVGLACGLLSLLIPWPNVQAETKPDAPAQVTVSINDKTTAEPTIPLGWTRDLPPQDPFGAPAAWVALKTQGNAELASPVSAMQINHPTFGYAVRPGHWVWRKMDDDIRARLINAAAPDQTSSNEVEKLNTRIQNAVQILTEE